MRGFLLGVDVVPYVAAIGAPGRHGCGGFPYFQRAIESADAAVLAISRIGQREMDGSGPRAAEVAKSAAVGAAIVKVAQIALPVRGKCHPDVISGASVSEIT